MKRTILTLCALLLLLLAGCENETQQKEEITNTANMPKETTTQAEAPQETQTTGETTPQETNNIDSAELAKHDNAQDCWVVYEEEVYDVSSYTSKHPGGAEAITEHCGSENFEEAFTGEHGKSKVNKLKAETEKVGVYVG